MSVTVTTMVSLPVVWEMLNRFESGQQFAFTEKSRTRLSVKEYRKSESRPFTPGVLWARHLLDRAEKVIDAPGSVVNFAHDSEKKHSIAAVAGINSFFMK